jgi:halocyanin-like protein
MTESNPALSMSKRKGDSEVDRRTVLQGVGTIAAAGMLAGCGGSGDGGDGEDGEDGDGGDGGATATATATDTATPTEEEMATPTEEDTATPTEEDTATPTEEDTATPSGGEVPGEVQDYLSDVGNYDGVQDMTGQDSVTIEVGAQGNGGAFAFAPPAVRIDPGTTVTWEWTGEGGQHNVVDEGGNFESELKASGSFEQTFDSSGSVRYFCQPHKSLGMKAAIIVTEGGGGMSTPTETATPSGPPQEVQDYLSDVGNYDGVQDMTGQDSVTIEVGAQGNGGAFAFAPAAVRIDSGTTVTWEWTGEGGQHNVVHEGGNFESELKASGSFEQTFDSSGSVRYFCQPHKSLGMKAALIVE